jgi:hypothetical protein
MQFLLTQLLTLEVAPSLLSGSSTSRSRRSFLLQLFPFLCDCVVSKDPKVWMDIPPFVYRSSASSHTHTHSLLCLFLSSYHLLYLYLCLSSQHEVEIELLGLTWQRFANCYENSCTRSREKSAASDRSLIECLIGCKYVTLSYRSRTWWWSWW